MAADTVYVTLFNTITLLSGVSAAISSDLGVPFLQICLPQKLYRLASHGNRNQSAKFLKSVVILEAQSWFRNLQLIVSPGVERLPAGAKNGGDII